MTNEMPEWRARVIKEHDELQQKIEALDEFLGYPTNTGLRVVPMDKALLEEQLRIMKDYAKLLRLRLAVSQ